MPLNIIISNTISAYRKSGGGGTPYCPEALAYFAATGITDPVRQSAYNTLILSALNDGWWSDMISWNGMCNGSAGSNKYNIVNPVDSDPAHRIVFSGGWTYGTYGSTPNGINASADPFVNPSTEFANNGGFGFFIYSRTNLFSGLYGSANYSVNPGLYAQQNWAGNMYSGCYPVPDNAIIFTAANTRRLFVHSRTSSSHSSTWQDGNLLGQENTSGAVLPNQKFLWGARRASVSIDQYDTHEILMCGLTKGLSNATIANMTAAINAFAVAIGGNV